MVVAGLVGARLAYVGLNWTEYGGDLGSMIAIWDGGMTFYGGLAAGAAAGYVCVRRWRIRPAVFADLVAPSLALGYSVARIGCFLNGCCYGVPSALPWAARFYADGGVALTVPSHPVQIYSSASSMLIFFVLVRLQRASLRPGSLFGLWLVLSSIERFAMEILRKGVTATIFWHGFTQAQVVSVLLLIMGAAMVAAGMRARTRHA